MATIAAIGLIDHDTILTLNQYPERGGSALVTDVSTSAGGTTANTALALTRLGETVTLRAVIGTDAEGDEILRLLAEAGLSTGSITRRDDATGSETVLLDTSTGERTVLRRRGAAIRMDDMLDIAGLFSHDVVILDVDDAPLRRFLTDLPAHTQPDVRLLGPLTWSVDDPQPDAVEVACRFDAICGTERQFQQLFEVGETDELPHAIQLAMRGANLRAALVTLGLDGCQWVTPDDSGHVPAIPVAIVYTTGSGDAFVAGVAWGMARRLPWPETARFANAVAALSTRAVSAQASLPSLDDVKQLLQP